MDLSKYFHTAVLYCLSNMVGFQQAFHIIIHQADTSQLIFRAPIFLTFLELNRRVIRKNSLPFNYPELLLLTVQNQLAKHDL